MIASPHPFREVQPSGEQITLRIEGGPYDNYLTDSEGYTVVQNEVNEFVYAELAPNGDLQPSPFPVQGPSNRRSKGKKRKHLRPKDIKCEDRICEKYDEGRNNLTSVGSRRSLAASSGTLRNLVIPLLWSNHVNRTLPTPADLSILMDHEGPHELCPTGSVRDVFLENSYGALTLNSTVVDWVPVDGSETYYANGQSGRSTLTHHAINYALQYLDDNELVDFTEFDADNDGWIDSITILHSGYGAEWGETDAYGTAYTDRIWSHKWAIWTNPFRSRSGVRVYQYHISPAKWGVEGNEIGRIAVIAHETGHFLGLPDLYDTDGGGSGIGSWGMMANSWGFDGSQHYPPLLSAWSKLELGWAIAVTPSEGVNHIAAAGEVSEEPAIYRVEEGFPWGEYLLIENRQARSFDAKIPQGGLAVFHIDERASLTKEGFPGQYNWPENGMHYRVALLQADGRHSLERERNRGDSGDLYHGEGVDHIGPSDLPLGNGPYPNTDSYQYGLIKQTWVHITEISDSSDTMSFQYRVETPEPSVMPSAAPTAAPSNAPSVAPSVSPSEEPSEEPSDVPTETPSLAPSARPTLVPSAVPSGEPSETPSETPSVVQSSEPTLAPSWEPSTYVTDVPFSIVTSASTEAPSAVASNSTDGLTVSPTPMPTNSTEFSLSPSPTDSFTSNATNAPSMIPTNPSRSLPTTPTPTFSSTVSSRPIPTGSPTVSTTASPTAIRTGLQTISPTHSKTGGATPIPTPVLVPTPTRAPASPLATEMGTGPEPGLHTAYQKKPRKDLRAASQKDGRSDMSNKSSTSLSSRGSGTVTRKRSHASPTYKAEICLPPGQSCSGDSHCCSGNCRKLGEWRCK